MLLETAKKLQELHFPDSEDWYEQDGRMLDTEGLPIDLVWELMEECGSLCKDTFAIFRNTDLISTWVCGDWSGWDGGDFMYRAEYIDIDEALAQLWINIKTGVKA